jgi:arylsulfatase A-like enzyme
LLITVDTARYDRFSFTGSDAVATPNVDALAESGAVFLQAIAPAPLTLVSHASLMTGLMPTRHHVRNNGTYRLDDTAVTIAEILEGRGYRTGAFVGASVLNHEYGLDQGFDEYDDEMEGSRGTFPERRAESVAARALRWLRIKPSEPTFAWVHLFDAHWPYHPPEPEFSKYKDKPYEGEIAYVDRVVGELLRAWNADDRGRRTITVLTSDHGESLGEHGELAHGVFLYDTTLRVPLIFSGPGIPPGTTVTDQVELVDVMPTILSLLGFELPGGIDGRDLGPVIAGGAIPPRPAYVESLYGCLNYGWHGMRGLRTERWKAIDSGALELYDLAGDPRETESLTGGPTTPPESTDLLDRLTALADEGRSDESAYFEPSREMKESLVALGYVVEGDTREGPCFGPAARDNRFPKDVAHVVDSVTMALELVKHGFSEEALARCEKAIEKDPKNDWITDNCVKVSRTVEDHGAGSPAGGTCDLAGQAVWPALDRSLAMAETGSTNGLIDELRVLVQHFVEDGCEWKEPGQADRKPGSRLRATEQATRIGARMWSLGEYGMAAQAYAVAVALTPEAPELHYNLGVSWNRVGNLEAAERSLAEAERLDPAFPHVSGHLARIREAMSQRGITED